MTSWQQTSGRDQPCWPYQKYCFKLHTCFITTPLVLTQLFMDKCLTTDIRAKFISERTLCPSKYYTNSQSHSRLLHYSLLRSCSLSMSQSGQASLLFYRGHEFCARSHSYLGSRHSTACRIHLRGFKRIEVLPAYFSQSRLCTFRTLPFCTPVISHSLISKSRPLWSYSHLS